MKINEFEIETWMTLHEQNCLYNLTETCVKHMSLNELESLLGIDIKDKIMNLTMDYGPITGSNALKEAILKTYKTGSVDNITLTIGTINGNELVLRQLLNKNDHVICLLPSYQQLYEIPKEIGCEVSFIRLQEENNWLPCLEDFTSLLKDNTKAIILNCPNNPTGTTLSNELMNDLVNVIKDKNIYIFCDEVYKGLDYGTCQESFSDIYDKAIVTSSLSKVYSFAGLRLGWIKGPKEFIDQINFRRDYNIISTGPLNDYLGTIILNNKDKILQRNKKICSTNLKILKDWLDKEKLVDCVIPEHGTVCLLHYHLDMPSKVLCEKLQNETGVFFGPGDCFGVEHTLRFGFTHDNAEIKEGLEIFSKWLKKQ